MTRHTAGDIFLAVVFAAVGAIRGTRKLWDGIDDLTARLTGLGQSWDPGEDEDEDECPDVVAAEWSQR